MAKQRYTANEVATALQKTAGIISDAARLLGCSRQTVCNYMNRYTSVREAQIEARKALIDEAEIKLRELVEQGNITAIIFTLKTLGKSRGYVERVEFSMELKKAQQLVKAIEEAGEDASEVFDAMIARLDAEKKRKPGKDGATIRTENKHTPEEAAEIYRTLIESGALNGGDGSMDGSETDGVHSA